MAKTNEKRIMTKRHFRWGYLLGIIIVCFVVFSFCQQFGRYTSICDQKQVLTAQINELKDQQEQLIKQKERLNDDDYLENLAREKLGMVKKGEIRILTMTESDAPIVDKNNSDIH